MERVRIIIICLFLIREKIKVKMIYDIHIQHDIWKKWDDVIYTENFEELLQDKDIQVIVISTPSQFHYEYALKVP